MVLNSSTIDQPPTVNTLFDKMAVWRWTADKSFMVCMISEMVLISALRDGTDKIFTDKNVGMLKQSSKPHRSVQLYCT
jgi:hypothetical protein